MFLAGSYRGEYFGFGATTVSVFWDSRTPENTSYLFAGDMNGGGSPVNDLIYIPP